MLSTEYTSSPWRSTLGKVRFLFIDTKIWELFQPLSPAWDSPLFRKSVSKSESHCGKTSAWPLYREIFCCHRNAFPFFKCLFWPPFRLGLAASTRAGTVPGCLQLLQRNACALIWVLSLFWIAEPQGHLFVCLSVCLCSPCPGPLASTAWGK